MSSTLIIYKLARSNYLEVPDLLNASKACRKLHKFLSTNNVWKPVFTGLYPVGREFASDENIKSIVLECLKNETQRVDKIISLLKTAKPYVNVDEHLANIIGSSSPSLENLCEMSRIERTWHVMKGLTYNSDALLTFLRKVPEAASIHYKTPILTIDRLLELEGVK